VEAQPREGRKLQPGPRGGLEVEEELDVGRDGADHGDLVLARGIAEQPCTRCSRRPASSRTGSRRPQSCVPPPGRRAGGRGSHRFLFAEVERSVGCELTGPSQSRMIAFRATHTTDGERRLRRDWASISPARRRTRR
jgi:hypothetical protein